MIRGKDITILFITVLMVASSCIYAVDSKVQAGEKQNDRKWLTVGNKRIIIGVACGIASILARSLSKEADKALIPTNKNMTGAAIKHVVVNGLGYSSSAFAVGGILLSGLGVAKKIHIYYEGPSKLDFEQFKKKKV